MIIAEKAKEVRLIILSAETVYEIQEKIELEILVKTEGTISKIEVRI